MAYAFGDTQGPNINTTQEGNTSHFLHAVTSNLEPEVRKLIKDDADVNKADEEGKTPLFYAVLHGKENMVRILIEEGKALVNARDSYGRSPLFYAMINSRTLVPYLLNKKACIRSKDNCGVNILSFFIENFMFNKISYPYPSLSDEIKVIFAEQRMTGKTIFEAMINVIFCKSLLLFSPCAPDLTTFSLVLESAKTYITDEKEQKVRIIDEVLVMMREIANDKILSANLMPKILDLLFELGANPNIADSDGNTALHYAVCLPFYGVPEKTIMDILEKLEDVGITFTGINHRKETPLLFCFSWRRNDMHSNSFENNQLPRVKTLIEIWDFLLKRAGSKVEKMTNCKSSFFHLFLELLQQLLKSQNISEINKEIKQWKLLSTLRVAKEVFAVNKEGLSPVHLWASLEPVKGCFNNVTDEGRAFKELLETLFSHFRRFKIDLNVKNENGERPLHMCRTWTAFTLLLDAEANPNVVDSSGRTPLLVAARNGTFLENSERFYPDIMLQAKEFWEKVLEKRLDPWTFDKHNESMLGILIKSEALVLAKTLIEVSCEKNRLQSDIDIYSLLNAICKDTSLQEWKRDYVHMVLKSMGSPISTIQTETSPLHLCCRNIIYIEQSKNLSVVDLKQCVHWTIAKLLIIYKADSRIPDKIGQSCHDIAEGCPVLKNLLITPIDIKEVPNFIHLKRPVSITHREKLIEISKFCKCEVLDSFWYHQDCISAKGSLGCEVFAGINKDDRMEVAIKRVDKKNKNRTYNQEIKNLLKLKDCTHVVRYYCSIERVSGKFMYVIFELMEESLSELLKKPIEVEDRKILCKQFLEGVHYMHQEGIIHCNLKPSNILIKTYHGLCLKIAGFGLSRDIDDSSLTTVYGAAKDSKCWVAPEVLKFDHKVNSKIPHPHSIKSDMFSCGLLIHFILFGKHPYQPASLDPKKISQRNSKVEFNIKHGIKNWQESPLSPESCHLLENVLLVEKEKRSTAKELLEFPFFWSKEKKDNFLVKVSNENIVKPTVLQIENSFNVIVKCKTWHSEENIKFGRLRMPDIYEAVNNKGYTLYNTSSVGGLLRFIRNANQHVNDISDEEIAKLVRAKVFLDYFPNLVVEVYKAIIKLEWHKKRQDIKAAINF